MSKHGTLRVEDWGVSDEYRKAPLELHVVTPGTHAMAKAIRTGITLPGYPSRAAYNLDGEYYVFEGKLLIPYDEWHAAALRAAKGGCDAHWHPRRVRRRPGPR